MGNLGAWMAYTDVRVIGTHGKESTEMKTPFETRTEKGRVRIVVLTAIATIVLGFGTLGLFTGQGLSVYVGLAGIFGALWALFHLANKVAEWTERGEQ